MRIEVDDLSRQPVLDLLTEHLADMHRTSRPEHVFALDVSGLRAPEVTFWTIWDGTTLMGCGALKEIDRNQGEIKSMRTPSALRGRGAGRAMLEHIVGSARSRGYAHLYLETGSHPYFEPAQSLYRSFGFGYCGHFAGYAENGNSVFMTLRL